MNVKSVVSASIALAFVLLLAFLLQRQRGQAQAPHGIQERAIHKRAAPDEGLAKPPQGSRITASDQADSSRSPNSAEGIGLEAESEILVRGTVIDFDGFPVDEATILLATDVAEGIKTLDCLEFDPKELASTKTSSNGSFVSSVQPGSSLSLAVRARGYAPLDRLLELRRSRTEINLGQLVLEPGIDLAGRVVDPAGVGRADVRLIRILVPPGLFEKAGLGESLAGSTGADGAFVIGGFPIGRWELRIESDGYPSITATGERHDAGTEAGLYFQLREGVWARGRVKAPRALDPKTVEVRASVAQGETRQSGIPPRAYFATGLCNGYGVFELGPFQPELKGTLFSFQARLRGPTGIIPLSTEITSRLGETEVVLLVPELSSLRFSLNDKRSGMPVGGARVSANLFEFGNQRTIEASSVGMVAQPEEGHYVLNLPTASGAADLDLRLLAEGYHELRIEGIRIEAETQLDLGSHALIARPMAHVVVVDETSGNPIAGARVIAASADVLRSQSDTRESTGLGDASLREYRVTDAVGRASIPLAEDQATWITALHEEYAPATPVSSPAATTPREEEIELHLSRGATVIVEVLNRNGDAVPNVSIRAESSVEDTISRLVHPYATTGWSRKTDENGLATFRGLPAGTHSFRLEKVLGLGQEDPNWKLVNVRSNEEHHLSLTTGRLVRVAGVVRRDGIPLEGAEVLLVPEEERARAWELRSFDGLESSGLMRRTDSAGRFAFELADPGHYRLEVRPRATQMPVPEVRSLVVGDKNADVVIDLSSSVLTGRVVDASGRSLAGARVVLCQPDDLNRAFAHLRYALHFAPVGSSSPLAEGVTTDREGRFVIRDVPVGTPLFALAIAHGFYQPAPIQLEFPAAGGEFDLLVPLATAGSVEVLVRSESGIPLLQRGVNRAVAKLEGGNWPMSEECAYPNAQGVAVFTVLRPGRWNVGLGTVVGVDLSVPAQVVEVKPGTVAKLVFSVR